MNNSGPQPKQPKRRPPKPINFSIQVKYEDQEEPEHYPMLCVLSTLTIGEVKQLIADRRKIDVSKVNIHAPDGANLADSERLKSHYELYAPVSASIAN
jgi:hypothetical protein